jgi:heme a synthase
VRRLSLPSFEWLVVATWIALLVNFVSGALVRVSNSGLGCPDWPLCNGSPTPPLAGHAVIEFSNRVLALVVVLTTVALAVRGRRLLATAIAAGTVAQVPLGGLTIYVDLHPVAVASHFMLAIAVFSLATVLLVDVRAPGAGVSGRPAGMSASSALVALVGLGLIVSGAIVTTSGPHPGADDVQRLYDLLDVAYWHVRIALAFVLVLAGYLLHLSRWRDAPMLVRRLAWAVVGLTALQIVIGEVQWRNELPWYLVWAHVVNATLLWAAIVALARSSSRPSPPAG